MAVFVQRAAGFDLVAADPATFPDVPDGYWAFGEIEACVATGVVQGYDDGLYRPTNYVNRGEMSAYMINATGGSTSAYTADRFSDVAPGDPFADHIEACVLAEIVQGYPDGFYRPGRLVNRGEMSVFVWRALVSDVVLYGAVGTTDAAVAPGGAGTAALIAPDSIGITDAADAPLAEGVYVYVVLDAAKVAAGTVTFEVVDSGDVVDATDNVTITAGDKTAYVADIDAGDLPFLVVSYEIPSGLDADDYTVTVELPNGAVLDAGGFTVAP
jgi:hypothetical protein